MLDNLDFQGYYGLHRAYFIIIVMLFVLIVMLVTYEARKSFFNELHKQLKFKMAEVYAAR